MIATIDKFATKFIRTKLLVCHTCVIRLVDGFFAQQVNTFKISATAIHRLIITTIGAMTKVRRVLLEFLTGRQHGKAYSQCYNQSHLDEIRGIIEKAYRGPGKIVFSSDPKELLKKLVDIIKIEKEKNHNGG